MLFNYITIIKGFVSEQVSTLEATAMSLREVERQGVVIKTDGLQAYLWTPWFECYRFVGYYETISFAFQSTYWRSSLDPVACERAQGETCIWCHIHRHTPWPCPHPRPLLKRQRTHRIPNTPSNSGCTLFLPNPSSFPGHHLYFLNRNLFLKTCYLKILPGAHFLW